MHLWCGVGVLLLVTWEGCADALLVWEGATRRGCGTMCACDAISVHEAGVVQRGSLLLVVRGIWYTWSAANGIITRGHGDGQVLLLGRWVSVRLCIIPWSQRGNIFVGLGGLGTDGEKVVQMRNLWNLCASQI